MTAASWSFPVGFSSEGGSIASVWNVAIAERRSLKPECAPFLLLKNGCRSHPHERAKNEGAAIVAGACVEGCGRRWKRVIQRVTAVFPT